MTTQDMIAAQHPHSGQPGTLLTPEQRILCAQAAAGEDLDGRRAQALLALDEGASQGEAGQRARLTRSQVQYALRKFRKMGMDMFSEAAFAPPMLEIESGSGPAPQSEPVMDAAGARKKDVKKKRKTGKKSGKDKKKAKKKGKGKKKGDGKSSQKKGKKKRKKKGKR